MSLIPVMTWYDTETGQTFQKSLASDENGEPLFKAPVGFRYVSNDTLSSITELPVEIMLDEDGNPLGQLPTRSNPTDAGLDIFSAEDVIIYPNSHPNSFAPGEEHRVLVRTGIKVEVAPGLGLFLWDRSGMSAKHGIHRVAGVLDASYRGEILVALVNLSNQIYQIKKGDRIAQGVLAPRETK